METNNKSTPKDVFYHLLAIVTLYVSVVSFIALVFQYVNVLFPDQLDFYYTRVTDIIRRSAASLFVVWPVYVLMSWLAGRDFAARPEKREVKVRKWLLYLTLFVAAIAIIVDLITLIYNFLGGELTIRFFLKILSVLVVAGAVFGYYLWDLHRPTGDSSAKPKMLVWIISVVILIVLSASFWIVGSPGQQRARRMDEQRVNDLQTVQNEIVNFWTQKEVLPVSLDDLQDSISGFAPPVDPDTKEPYEYIVKDKLSFDLCAEFKTIEPLRGRLKQVDRPVYGPYQQNWEHEAGRVCFNREIDPELYKNETGRKIPLIPFSD